jgi:hypothetical protein
MSAFGKRAAPSERPALARTGRSTRIPFSRPRIHRRFDVRYAITTHKNPTDNHGIAATTSSATTNAPIYGQIRHNESSGLVRPIAHAP